MVELAKMNLGALDHYCLGLDTISDTDSVCDASYVDKLISGFDDLYKYHGMPLIAVSFEKISGNPLILETNPDWPKIPDYPGWELEDSFCIFTKTDDGYFCLGYAIPHDDLDSSLRHVYVPSPGAIYSAVLEKNGFIRNSDFSKILKKYYSYFRIDYSMSGEIASKLLADAKASEKNPIIFPDISGMVDFLSNRSYTIFYESDNSDDAGCFYINSKKYFDLSEQKIPDIDTCFFHDLKSISPNPVQSNIDVGDYRLTYRHTDLLPSYYSGVSGADDISGVVCLEIDESDVSGQTIIPVGFMRKSNTSELIPSTFYSSLIAADESCSDRKLKNIVMTMNQLFNTKEPLAGLLNCGLFDGTLRLYYSLLGDSGLNEEGKRIKTIFYALYESPSSVKIINEGGIEFNITPQSNRLKEEIYSKIYKS